MTTRPHRFHRFPSPEPEPEGLPIRHPLPKHLLPEARGFRVTRLRASLRRPPRFRPSLS